LVGYFETETGLELVYGKTNKLGFDYKGFRIKESTTKSALPTNNVPTDFSENIQLGDKIKNGNIFTAVNPFDRYNVISNDVTITGEGDVEAKGFVFDDKNYTIPFVHALALLGPYQVIQEDLSYLRQYDEKRSDYNKIVRKSKSRTALEQIIYYQTLADLPKMQNPDEPIDKLDISDKLKKKIKIFRDKLYSNYEFINPIKHTSIKDLQEALKVASVYNELVKEHTQLMRETIKELYGIDAKTV
jgi:hypothetical protein